jgi:Tol biopolymer transport system component/predicted Ser/Thr protein kinase
MDLKRGDILHERYLIESMLGQGGMGAVYLARDQNLDQMVAIKVNRDPSEQASKQFLKEAQLLATLHHTNLPRVFDYFISEMDEILVMDYIPGDDLAALIKKEGAQPLESVIGWVEQLGAALSYMHQQKPPVTHRDIKPGNVKLTPTGEAILVDFGIAKASETSQMTATGATGYTPGFAPPEQVGGMRTGPYSDQYSLAATIYQLLSGRQPEDAIQRGLGKETLTPICQLVPALPPHVGRALERALALRPEQRFQDIDDFLQALKDPDFKPAAAGPVVQRQKTQPAGGLKAKYTKTWLFRLAGLLVILAGIATAGYFFLPGIVAKQSLTATATVDVNAVMSTNVASAANATRTHIAYLAGETATASVPTPTLTPDRIILGGGGNLAFVSDRGDGKTLQIWTMDIFMDNQSLIFHGEPRQLTHTEGDKNQPAWSPDGNQIAFVAPGGGRNGLDIWVMKADGSDVTNLTNKPGDEFDPAWSPDSTLIAYTKPTEEDSPLLYLMRRNGSDVQLLSELYQESQATWSADKHWLVYVISAQGHEYLYMRGIQGGSLVPVAFDLDSYFGRLGEVSHPVFSPDGDWIAYIRRDFSRSFVYTVNFESRGNDIQQLTTSGSEDYPAWSADNHWIAYQSMRDGNLEIYLMTSSGLMQTRLTDNPARDQQPAWKIK